MLIGFSLADAEFVPRLVSAAGAEPVSPGRLDSWLQIGSDGAVRVLTGKAEIGMGVETALAQIVAEELDLSTDRIHLTLGDTSITPDQGGVGGSTSIAQGAHPLRNAAATARALLVGLAADRLGVAADQLVTGDGFVMVTDQRQRRVSYADLAAEVRLADALKVSGQGFGLNVEGIGRPKDPKAYTVVGTSVPRKDLPSKILGQFQYVGDVRVPQMLHARLVRPPAAGAHVISVDEQSVKGVGDVVRVVAKGDFIGVVARTEWGAIRAAKALKVTWSAVDPVFPPQTDLYARLRAMTPKSSRETVKTGDVAAALAGASRRLQASYDFPFQSHATMGPGCAVADVHIDGVTTVWCGAQKPHALQRGLAALLGRPADTVRIVWVEDAGSYGRPGFEDAAADAVLLSQAVGRPVRVQWSRADMTAWGAKGPPVVCDLEAAMDGGTVTALRYVSRALSGTEIVPVPGTAGNFLAAHLTGIRNERPGEEFAIWGVQTMAYGFPNVHAVAHVLPPFTEVASPLRTTHLRDPNGPAATFAVESFVDEIAAALNQDPLAFRLAHLTDDRARAVLRAAADRAAWEARPSPRTRPAASRGVATGRGIAVGARNGTYVATVAEVEVDVSSGATRVARLVCAHDCGLVVNPRALEATISANLVQSLGRTMKEEVAFDTRTATSADWLSYPVARARDVPSAIDVVLIARADVAPTGAGEAASRPTAAAIGNAIFDACAARVRQVPFTSARVKAVLARPQPAGTGG